MFTTRHNWKLEIPVLKELGKMGYTQTSLAKKYGVTRQRMKQIVDRYIPDWHENYGYAVNRKIDAEEHFKKWGLKEDTDLYRAQRTKFRAKRTNAQAKGWTWDLEFGDLFWPTHCPVFGVELNYFAESRSENSPSFDQIKPSMGYVKGNVRVMSWRANRIKNDGNAEEHRQIAAFLDSLAKDTIDMQ